jgi:hypothetical protein
MQHTATADERAAQRRADFPTHHARSGQIKVLAGDANVFLQGPLTGPRKFIVSSTETSNLKYGYSPLLQHTVHGEYVFAFARATVISNPPQAPEPETQLELEEPFAYCGLSVSGVYCFRWTRRGVTIVSLSGAKAEMG